MHIATDHSYSGKRIELEETVLGGAGVPGAEVGEEMTVYLQQHFPNAVPTTRFANPKDGGEDSAQSQPPFARA